MRPRDVQDLDRRLALKERDGGADRMILLLADSGANRELVRAHRDALTARFPISGRQALAAIRARRDPGGNAVILL